MKSRSMARLETEANANKLIFTSWQWYLIIYFSKHSVINHPLFFPRIESPQRTNKQNHPTYPTKYRTSITALIQIVKSTKFYLFAKNPY